ncbi:hypothetical protein OB2597_12231 [Pseudooceanicola batsensis HTCC2597]|uniref:NAD-specific glutamate dehydrogenase n=1 Tax=Pseudooceanicola batsensis (strain ATCC BAA-863 / DSM 15984 / KCTC 12145 / HTCC2597) TaxID=252305 RepID=A3TWL6_PSEBH|nr:hypothetical protein OB2597_12231 [Pseudooceanicola batsensis HTCC2597]
MRFLERDVEGFQQTVILDTLALYRRPAAGQFPVGAGGEILERLHTVLGQGLNHLGCQPLEFNKAVFGTQFAGAFHRRLGLGLENVTGARLQFVRRLFVDAVDHQQLVDLDICDLFEVREAFGNEKLGEEFVQIERIDEQLGAFLELFLTTGRFLFFRHDVDVERGKLRCQTHVLTAPADGERKLLFRHHHLDPLGLFVENHLGDLGGLQRVDEEGRLILVPGDDVDLFALKFVHHGLNAAAAHPDTGADRVDRPVVGDHGDLGARPRIAGDGLDLDDSLVDLGHFHLEELGHELRIGAAQEDLRPALFAAHILDVAADPVVRAIALAADLLVPAQDGFAPAHIDDDIAVFLALDDTVDDRAGAVLEFLVLAVALGLAHLLENHLLGGLGCDPAHVDRRNLFGEGVADLRIGHVLPGLLNRHLGLVILQLLVLDHGADAGKGRAARLAVDRHADVHLGAVAALRGAGEGFLHRFDNQAGVDHLLARDRFGGLQKFKLVGRGNRHRFSPPRNLPQSQCRRIGFRRAAPRPCAP